MMSETIRIALNPLEGVCYAGYQLDAATGQDLWLGPPGVGVLIAQDLERRLNFTSQKIFCNNIWGNPTIGDEPDHPNNQGIVARLERGEADWSPCAVTRTLRRYVAVKYSNTPLTMVELMMAARRPELHHGHDDKLVRPDSVLQPFDTKTWYILMVFFFFYGLLSGICHLILDPTHRNDDLLALVRLVAFHWINLFCPLLMKCIPNREMGRGPRRVIFVIWCVPTLVLGMFYGGELICYLSNAAISTLISSWEQLYGEIFSGSIHAVAFSGSWLKQDAHNVFGPEIAAKLEWCDTYDACFDMMIADEKLAWIETSNEMMAILSMHDVHIPQEVYLMGEGFGLGSGFDGFAFSPASRDIQRRFEPWLMYYTEMGHITHWMAESDVAIRAYSRSANEMKKNNTAHAGRHHHDEDDMKKIDLEDMTGAYVCYLIFGCFAGLMLLTESLIPIVRPKSKVDVKTILILVAEDDTAWAGHFRRRTESRSLSITPKYHNRLKLESQLIDLMSNRMKTVSDYNNQQTATSFLSSSSSSGFTYSSTHAYGSFRDTT